MNYKNERRTQITFSVPSILDESSTNIDISTNSFPKPSKEEIINQAIKFQLQGNISEAKRTYEYCLKQNFNDYRVFSNYGIILKDLGKFKEAEILQRKAIELKPDVPIAYSNLGTILKQIGKLDEAEIFTRKAIELKPDFCDAHLNLGDILRKFGRLKEAELSTCHAIELKPNFVMAHSNLAIILREQGKLIEAEKSICKAIELKPDSAESYLVLGNILRETGRLVEAEISTCKAIEINSNYAEAHSNLGNILREAGKLVEAEISTSKAIDLKPNCAEAYVNLGTILRELGKLGESEISFLKAIELNPDLVKVYYYLSTLKSSNNFSIWKKRLFSDYILINKGKKDLVDIYFARSGFLHNEKKYKESSKYLQLANDIKLDLKSFNLKTYLKESRALMIESDNNQIRKQESLRLTDNIFIVGMPRSGSTLLESIISMNINVEGLGEINVLEESFLEWMRIDKRIPLADLYLKRVDKYKSKSKIKTIKWLYNYRYVGIIASQIPNAKILHCFRNPLDNILSIFRAHFVSGNEYSSSLVDCAKVYLDQEEIMTEYKNRFRSQIREVNYDLLVKYPNNEIRSLIEWLGWEWNDSYLSPHLNPRPVSTASTVQVRSPINPKSVGGWKNYSQMLQPAIKVIEEHKKYTNIKST